ncbi:hypothetical protein H6G36_25495 [Anabaena minutissima FACHB-250]|nr:hypothetical protein [Anabaena minutissima FACHB-250]
MPKESIKFQDLIDQVQQGFSKTEPGQAYLDCEQEYGGIEGSSAIWRLVEEAIAYAVQETVDYLDGHEVEH